MSEGDIESEKPGHMEVGDKISNLLANKVIELLNGKKEVVYTFSMFSEQVSKI